MRKISLMFALFLLFVTFSFAQNIAYMDIQKVMNMSKEGLKYKEEIKEKIKYYEEKVKEFEAKISELEKQLESPVLSEEGRKKKMEEKRKFERELSRIEQQANEELSKMKADAEQNLIKKIIDVVSQYARKKNIDLVFIGGTYSGILYASDKIDITDEIIKEMNKGEK
ncbi:OmpH family outer membrane protein [Persephonella sp.]